MQDSTETDERRGNKPSLLSQAQSAKELKTPLVDNFLGSTLQPSDVRSKRNESILRFIPLSPMKHNDMAQCSAHSWLLHLS